MAVLRKGIKARGMETNNPSGHCGMNFLRWPFQQCITYPKDVSIHPSPIKLLKIKNNKKVLKE